jgi:hypothetical protein
MKVPDNGPVPVPERLVPHDHHRNQDSQFTPLASLSVFNVLKIISARRLIHQGSKGLMKSQEEGGKVSVLVGEVVESGYCSKLYWTR